MSRTRILAGAALAALALSSALAPAARAAPTAAPAIPGRSPFDGVVAFGDSLSDDGNIAAALGLPAAQRYTTNPGTVTIENVAAAYGFTLTPSLKGGTDFAYGGAGVTTNSPGTPSSVPTQTAQIAGYLAANPKLDPHALYSVFAGANDIFSASVALFTGQVSAAQATATIAAAGTTEGAQVAQLQAAGAKTILVFNLPDVGLTPQSLGLNPLIPGSAAQITALSQAYNASLNAAIAAHPGGVVPVNTFALLREVVANPAALGFTNVTTAACTTGSSFDCTPATLRTPDAATTYLFADGVHPTTATHAIFAQAVVAEISAPSYVSLLAEAPLQASAAQRGAFEQELAVDGADPTARTRVFGRFDYAGQSFDAAGYTGRAADDGGTATVGVDWRATPDLSLGAAFSAGRSFADFDDGGLKFRTETYLLSLFGQYRVLRRGYVDGSFGFGDVQFDDVARSFALGPSRRVERGETDGSMVTATLGGGWWFGGEALRYGPYIQGRYEHVGVGGYAEQGSDATAMTFGAQSRESLVGEAGLKAQGSWRTGFGVLAPYASIGYAYDGRAQARYVEGGLVTLPGTFAVPGYEPAQSWGVLQAGIEARFARGWSVFAGYQGRFADDSQSLNAANVGVKLAF